MLRKRDPPESPRAHQPQLSERLLPSVLVALRSPRSHDRGSSPAIPRASSLKAAACVSICKNFDLCTPSKRFPAVSAGSCPTGDRWLTRRQEHQ